MPDKEPIKFLLVDDLEANLLALEQLLERDHLDLLKARSGEEALEILLEQEIALALVDVQMPGMNGFELAELMRGSERTKSIPIIFLTAGEVDRKRRVRGYETGAIDFLPKPIDPDMLLNKATVFYDLARQRQVLRKREIQLSEANELLERSNAKLERADRSKDEFLAMLAHELRNPLAPLLSGVDVILNSSTKREKIEDIGAMMKRQVSQMAHLIDDLLDVSRITTGKIELQIEPVPLARVIEQAVESVEPLMREKGHHLEVGGAAGRLEVSGDPFRLTQVVSNLLTNAAKYTPDGGRIGLEVTYLGDGRVGITVADNGRGIPPERQARIFDLFDQGENGAKDGLGLGLTLVKKLVGMHGGEIQVESEGEGRGSRFLIELPEAREMTESEASESEPDLADTGEGRRSERPVQVLVADDGRATADTLKLFFEMEGAEALVAYDGDQAIEKAKASKPDLVCLDLGMPTVDGYEAAREIRRIHPGAYLVALSGWGSNEDRLRTAEAGFDEHLVKPVKPDQLRELLERIP